MNVRPHNNTRVIHALLCCIMQPVHLPVELQLLVLTEVLIGAEIKCSNLIQRETVQLFIMPLLLACRTFHDYVAAHPLYHRIRLWLLIIQITKQDLPVPLAVVKGNAKTLARGDFTVLDMQIRVERVGPSSSEQDQQAFLVFEEQNLLSQGRLKHTRESNYLVSEMAPRTSRSRTGIADQCGGTEQMATTTPLFQYHQFLVDMLEFARRNELCVWIWKRSVRFFSGPNVGVLVGGNRNRGTQRSIYLIDDRPSEPIDCYNGLGHCIVCHRYRENPNALQFHVVVDSPRNGFLAYEHPVDPPRNFTQDMLSNNVHFFAGLG
ncbi:hypothetical protein NQZ79_g3401 [Umbelopsis isabellina]|nr:hypothetical protein NQZ79_g3401 [Umbelopsis isabellina]